MNESKEEGGEKDTRCCMHSPQMAGSEDSVPEVQGKPVTGGRCTDHGPPAPGALAAGLGQMSGLGCHLTVIQLWSGSPGTSVTLGHAGSVAHLL